MELNSKLSTDDGPPLDDPSVFRGIVGSLLYLTMTRPDISHAIHTVSQFVSNPHKPHLAAALHILRYVKGTLNHGLFYLLAHLCTYQPMRMLTELVAQTLGDLPLAGACFLGNL